jgi:hypothetical protein
MMTSRSKIKVFSIIVIFTLSLFSCAKEKNDVVPDTYVDFYISLTDPQFFDLTAILGYEYVDVSTNNLGYRAAGYDNNGIIVFRGMESEFYAFDRTCPHDFAVNGLSVKVDVVDMIYAFCPRCSTKYALPNFGTPASGIGRYPLKNYKTSFDGTNIHVWN